MIICLTVHQSYQFETDESTHLLDRVNHLLNSISPPVNKKTTSKVTDVLNVKKPKRKKINMDMPLNEAPLYIEIEPEDIIAIVPLGFGGSQLVFLSPISSTKLPTGFNNGERLIQKNQTIITVKEPPSQIISMLGITGIKGT